MEEARTKMEAQDLRNKFGDLKKDLVEAAKRTTDSVVTDSKEWVKEHPATAVGIVTAMAAGIGFLIGLLVGRNRG